MSLLPLKEVWFLFFHDLIPDMSVLHLPYIGKTIEFCL